MAIFIGVDPGLTGSIAIIDQDRRPIVVIDIPTMMRGISKTVIKKQFDAGTTRDLIADRLCHYADEQLHGWVEMPFSVPDGNIMGMNSLFQTYGGLLAVLEVLGVQTHTVQASKWKSKMGLNKQKDYSLDIARQMWPTIQLSAKKHHNRAESLLIAEYGRLLWQYDRRYKAVSI